MAYDLTGKIKLIQEAKTFDSGFTKREMVVIVEDGKYPQEINIEFVQDKVSLLNDLQVGQGVTVTFDIRGREYNGRYFNNLQGWKIVTLADESAFATEEQSSASHNVAPTDFDDNDIPFLALEEFKRATGQLRVDAPWPSSRATSKSRQGGQLSRRPRSPSSKQKRGPTLVGPRFRSSLNRTEN